MDFFLQLYLKKMINFWNGGRLNDVFDLYLYRISDNPKLQMLREGLKLFLTHFLLKHAQAQKSAEEASLLKERVELATKALEAKEPKLKL